MQAPEPKAARQEYNNPRNIGIAFNTGLSTPFDSSLDMCKFLLFVIVTRTEC
jgi:hypothetical protein